MSAAFAVTNEDAKPILQRFREVFLSEFVANDTDMPECVLASYVANMLPVSPVWLLIVGPPSSGKTAVLKILSKLPRIVHASTITESSLLSGVPTKEKSKGATGGLLRVLGKQGVFVCKDFTSVLSMSKDAQNSSIAALREIHDGEWVRHFGSDGGKSESWSGKAGFIGAVTQIIDQRHAVMSLMGERFILFRLNTDDDISMLMTRHAVEYHTKIEDGNGVLPKLAKAIVDLVKVPDQCLPFPEGLNEKLSDLAFLVCRSRTAVERNGYSREIEGIPYPEEPPRLSKHLSSLIQGLLAIGNTYEEAWDKVKRIGFDSIPELRRRAIYFLLAQSEAARTSEVAEYCKYPPTSTRRALEELAYFRQVIQDGYNATEQWRLSDEVFKRVCRIESALDLELTYTRNFVLSDSPENTGKPLSLTLPKREDRNRVNLPIEPTRFISDSARTVQVKSS